MNRPGPTPSEADLLRAALDAVPAMIACWSQDLRNLVANAAYLDWFGVSPQDMSGQHIRDVIGDELFALNEQHMRQALQGTPQHFERRIVDAAGKVRHSQISYLPDRGEEGVQGFFVLVTDVTERNIAQELLTDETARIRTILDAVSDAVISVEPDLRISDLNVAALHLLGVARERTICGCLAEVIQIVEGEEEVDVAGLCAQALQTGAPVQRHHSDLLLAADGRQIPIDWMITPIRDSAGGGPGSLVLTLRNAGDARRRLEESQHEATHDPLTGLRNRNYLRRIGDRRESPAGPTAVLMIDLDGFKAVNDAAGHLAGDAVLRQVSGWLRESVRRTDVVIRMGGDEFVVLAYGCSTVNALKLATKISQGLAAQIFTWQGERFRIGGSVGVAMSDGAGPAALDGALGESDAACYAAKRAGGSQVRMHGGRPGADVVSGC